MVRGQLVTRVLGSAARRRPLLAAACALAAFSASATTAAAATNVSALSGNVAVLAEDSSPQDLTVTVSGLDVGHRVRKVGDVKSTFPGARAASTQVSAAAEAMKYGYTGDLVPRVHSSVGELQSAYDRLVALAPDNSARSVRAAGAATLLDQAKALEREVLDAGRAADLATHVYSDSVWLRDLTQADALEAVAKYGDDSEEAVRSALRWYQAAEVAVRAGAEADEKAGAIKGLAERIVALARQAIPQLGDTPNDQAVKAALEFCMDTVTRFAKRLKNLSTLINASYKVTHGILLAFGMAATAYAFGLFDTAHAAELEQVESDHRLIIQNRGPSELRPSGDCERYLRTVKGRMLENAVSCPLPDQPGWFANAFSVFSDGTLVIGNGLHISTGDGKDVINVKIPADVDAPLITVMSGGGDDTVRTPTQHSVWVVGGGGRDQIVTGQRDDYVWGDAPGLDAGNLPNPDTYSDTLVTNGGDDYVDAQQGNNLVLAGSGADTVTAGDGSNVLVGGNDVDNVRNGAGPSLLVGAELDGLSVLDAMIDCGPGNSKYVLATPGLDANGFPEADPNCRDGAPHNPPSAADLAAAGDDAPPVGGNWPWIG